MTQIDRSAKIEKFLHKEAKTVAIDSVFVENGRYNLFGKYQIERKNKGYCVTMPTTSTEKSFYKLKNAVAWCIFDKQNLIMQSERIELLDSKLSGIEVALAIHEKLCKKAKSHEDRFIFLAKLNEDKLKRNQISRELQGYIMSSDNLQRKRFETKLFK